MIKTLYIEKNDIQALRSSMSSREWLPFWVILETGLRVGDVVKIRVDEVFEDGIFYKAQKTGKFGFAFISPELREALLQNARGVWVFPSPKNRGEHLTRQAVWARLKKAAERAGINPEGIAPHSCRKVFAVELLRRSDLRTVANALQHDRTSTSEIYALADWASGDNAALPLRRGDIAKIVEEILHIIGYRVDK